MSSSTAYIGKRIPRVIGKQKVTGKATYAAEVFPENMVYGYVVQAAIAKGTIKSITTESALAVPGVRLVFTHENLPSRVKGFFKNVRYRDRLSPPGHPFRPLNTDKVMYSGQPIALVVADNFETARYAAGLVEVTYEREGFIATLQENMTNGVTLKVMQPPDPRGNAAEAYTLSPYQIDATYVTPRHYANPMEPHASTVIWEGDGTVTIWDKIQGVGSTQGYIRRIFGMEQDQVRVKSLFVGGGFGSGLRPQYQVFMAMLAATELKCSARVVMTRAQMFSFGHRPSAVQQMRLAADQKGRLVSLYHKAYGETSTWENYSEDVVTWSGMMHQCDNVTLEYEVIPVNAYTPMDTRAPGGATGMFALECAIDELAVEAGIDPLQFRLDNYASQDQNSDKPFSSKELKKCYEQCAERFGWSQRPQTPKTLKRGNDLVGYGVAAGAWEAFQRESNAAATLNSYGELEVSAATGANGAGTYTAMTQIAAEYFGTDIRKVSFKLGDTDLPHAPMQGGSWTVSSVGSAVKKVCEEMHKELLQLAQQQAGSPFKDNKLEELTFADGRMTNSNGDTQKYSDIMLAAQKTRIKVDTLNLPNLDRKDYSCYSHNCVMAEVLVDEDLGTIRVPRITMVCAAGRIINPKLAENQIKGGIVWGVGMALHEEGMVDTQYGRIMNMNLAEYHVPVHADIKDIDVSFVTEKDDIVNPLGAKGVGELGVVGVASAIANAIYNATGKRVRKLPIHLDDVL